jgi:hypothetical protein
MVACDLSVLTEGWKLGNTRGCQLEGDQLERGLPLTAHKGRLELAILDRLQRYSETPASKKVFTMATTLTAADTFNYRYYHSTNLGTIFILEKWLSSSMYIYSTAGNSKLDAVQV